MEKTGQQTGIANLNDYVLRGRAVTQSFPAQPPLSGCTSTMSGKEAADNVPDGSFTTKFVESAKSVLGDAVKEFIPSNHVKVYHPQYFFPLSTAIIIALCGVFLGLFIPTITNELNSRYLSPASSPDRNCDPVPISNSGEFLATKAGFWQGAEGFEYSETTYAFSLSNLLYSEQEYADTMGFFSASLKSIGTISKGYDLGKTLSYWMSYVLIPPNTQSQRFYLHADPAVIFRREVVSGAVGSINGTCSPSTGWTEYEPGFGRLTLSMDYEESKSDPLCAAAITPELFGYIPKVHHDTFQVSLDVRSLVTTLAVNLGILSLDDIVEISGSSNIFPYVLDGVQYNLSVASFYDPRYPEMASIICLKESDIIVLPTGCISRLGTTLALPMFSHSGQSADWPSLCSCSDPNLGNLANPMHPCNLFSFLSGILFYNSSDPGAIFELGIKYDMATIANSSFFPMFIASSFAERSAHYPNLHSPQTLLDSYQWCYLPTYGYCRFLTFTSWDVTNFDYSVNEYFYQLRNGACTDTFAIPDANWQQLVDVPFAPLTQEYVVCRESVSNAVINSVGVTAGNISFLTPVIIVFFLVLAGAYQCCSGYAWPKGYHQTDKDDILDQLATLLLLLRDDKLRAHEDDDSEKSLKQLQISRISRELHLLNRQLVKQYDRPNQHSKRIGYGTRLKTKLRRSVRKHAPTEDNLAEDADIEVGEAENSDNVERHYGHYELVPPKALSIRGQI